MTANLELQSPLLILAPDRTHPRRDELRESHLLNSKTLKLPIPSEGFEPGYSNPHFASAAF